MPKQTPPELSPTSPGTPRLSELTKHLATPADIASTGWPAIRATCVKKLGTPFDPWQEGAGRVIFSKRADGSLATQVDGVGMSMPRQVGKTYLFAAIIFALCINRPGTLVIWSAHHGKTHAETFLAMQAFAKRLRVAPYVEQVYTGSGDESVVFHNGSRILFGAREHGFGRGIPGVDVMVFDEAQILSSKALANMLAAMNTSTLGLHVYIGTPPAPHDNSDAFRQMRKAAVAGELPDGAWIEFGANRGDDINSPATWSRANPSFPHRTPAASIRRLKRKLTPDDFLREALGIWDEDETGWHIVSSNVWALSQSPTQSLADAGLVPSLALAAAPEMTSAAIVGAALDGDDDVWVKTLAHGPGVAWVVEQAKRLQSLHRSPLVIDKGGPAKSLIEPLTAAGVQLELVASGFKCDADQALVTSLTQTRDVRHLGELELTSAMRAATWRKISDLRAFGRASGDITPLEAAALAVAHARTANYDVADSLY